MRIEYPVVDALGASPYICAQLQNKLHLVIKDQNNLDRQSSLNELPQRKILNVSPNL
jgi:hypothetical protein